MLLEEQQLSMNFFHPEREELETLRNYANIFEDRINAFLLENKNMIPSWKKIKDLKNNEDLKYYIVYCNHHPDFLLPSTFLIKLLEFVDNNYEDEDEDEGIY